MPREHKPNDRVPITLFDEDGNKIPEGQIKETLVIYWSPLYQRFPNYILTNWNDETKAIYKDIFVSRNDNIKGRYIDCIDIEYAII